MVMTMAYDLHINRCDHPDRTTEEKEQVMATITAKEFAAKVGTDPRTVRKFIRSESGLNTKVGKGQRWAIEGKQVASLTKRFAKWDEDRKAAKVAGDEVEVEETETE